MMKNCPVYFQVPLSAIASARYASKFIASVKKCFFAVKSRIARRLHSATTKELSSHGDSRGKGRTSQRLQRRICQYVPKFIKTGPVLNSRNTSTRFCKSSTPGMFG